MSKVRTGEMVGAAGGVALLIVMFLPWYGLRGREESLTAWGAFSVVDLLLALAAVLGILLLVVQVVGRGPAGPVALGVIAGTISIVALVIVAYRILNQPGPNDFVTVRVGAWLGLLATAVIVGGTWRYLSDERPRPVDPPAPEPERRPTPARS